MKCEYNNVIGSTKFKVNLLERSSEDEILKKDVKWNAGIETVKG